MESTYKDLEIAFLKLKLIETQITLLQHQHNEIFRIYEHLQKSTAGDIANQNQKD
jgi:hypothetical protein